MTSARPSIALDDQHYVARFVDLEMHVVVHRCFKSVGSYAVPKIDDKSISYGEYWATTAAFPVFVSPAIRASSETVRQTLTGPTDNLESEKGRCIVICTWKGNEEAEHQSSRVYFNSPFYLLLFRYNAPPYNAGTNVR